MRPRQHRRANSSNGRCASRNHRKPSDAQLPIRNHAPAAEASKLEFRARGGPKGSIGALFNDRVQFRVGPFGHFGHAQALLSSD
jgi:hypothetical protein